MPRSARRLVPHKEASNKCAPLTRLAELAVGLPVRWQKRVHGSSYKDDPDVLRVMLWHTWATKRVEYFHTVTCKTLSVKRRSEHRTGLDKWLVEKHDALRTARSSGKLLPVDVADQVMQIDIDEVLEQHLNLADGGAEEGKEARTAYRIKAHEAWEARQTRLDDFLGYWMSLEARDQLPVQHFRRMNRCISTAKSIKQISLHPCKAWGEELYFFTCHAGAQKALILALIEEDTLEATLDLLLDAMTKYATELFAQSDERYNAAAAMATYWSIPAIVHRLLGEDPAQVDEASSDWLDAQSYRHPRILPPAVGLNTDAHSEEAAAPHSLARLGLRAQRRYKISAAGWQRRWIPAAA